MKLDKKFLRSERQKRAWSQEHLAGATDLGLRTIQRIEQSGVASYESAQSIAAAFSLRIDDISLGPDAEQKTTPMWRAVAGVTALALVTSTALIFTHNSWAEQVMLDVGVSQNDEEMTNVQLVIADGKEAEMLISGAIRIKITPTIQDDGKVFLSAQIYKLVGGESVLLFEPKLITANNKEAEIRIGGETGNFLKLQVTPHTSD